MEIDAVCDFRDFLTLQPGWDSSFDRGGARSFFLSHAWFRCCWQSAEEGAQPVAMVARTGGNVLGIAPFMIQEAKWRMFPVRTAALMQNQDSPFAEVLLPSEHRSQVFEAILDRMVGTHRWDVASFAKVPEGSPTHQVLLASPADRRQINGPAAQSPLLRFDQPWDGFWQATSQRFKKTVRNIVNRVERLGNVTVEEMSEAASAGECIALFQGIAERSWKAGLPTSATRNPRIARFFEALTTELHARRQLLLWTLRIGGAPVACEYHVRDGDTIYALRSDFDDAYGDASPGAYLNYWIIRKYFESDLRAYDMGPGENEYKKRWAAVGRHLGTFSVFSRRSYGATLYTCERYLVPNLRRARSWWRSETPAVQAGAPSE